MKSSFLKDPLIGFIFLGGMIFFLNAVFADPDRESIQLKSETVDNLVQMRRELLGRDLTEDERLELVENHINQEILVSEAVARGLHLLDSRVRDRLVRKMYFLIDQEPPEPTESELRSFYEANQENYMLPPAVTFEHIFYGGEKGRRAAHTLLSKIRSGQVPTSDEGDPFWLGRKMEFYTAGQLASVLGFGFTGALQQLPLTNWAGPIRSARGWHVVRLDARHPAEPLPQDELQRRLRKDWAEQWKLDRRAQQINLLRNQYDVAMAPANS